MWRARSRSQAPRRDPGQLVCEEVERQGAPVSEEEVLELLRMDLDMNAQGLGMWMDKHPEAVTA